MEKETGCLLFDVEKHFGDNRGYFTEAFDERLDNLVFGEIVQTNVSKSRKNTIRGMHFNTKSPQAKALRVLHGSLLDVVIDLRWDSPMYGVVETFKLDRPNQCLLVPEGFAHGFWALEDDTILMYGCTELYEPKHDRGVSITDTQFNFPWRNQDLHFNDFPIENAINHTIKDIEWPAFDFNEKLFAVNNKYRFGCIKC